MMLCPKTLIVKDKAHLAFIRTLPCCCTGYEGDEVQPHHLLRTVDNQRGAAMKPGDDQTIPIRASVHYRLHNCAMDEREFLKQFNIYGPALAALLYRLTGNEDACRRAILEMRG